MRYRRGLVAWPLVALGLSGCAASPDAADLAGAPDPAALEVGRQRAAAAMRAYVETADAALRTGSTADLTELAEVTGAGCPCQELVAYISDRFANGAKLVGASFRAGAVTVLDRDGTRATVRAEVSVSEYDVRSADGLLLRTQRAQDFVAVYTLHFDDNAVAADGDEAAGWRVVDVRQRPAG